MRHVIYCGFKQAILFIAISYLVGHITSVTEVKGYIFLS